MSPSHHADKTRRRDFKRAFAKALRAAPTGAERLLWSRLRVGQLGVRFRRQQPIGPYIADFFCASARLVIELDGSQHGAGKAIAYDESRTRFLDARGYRVLRFFNEDVLKNIDGICDAILREIAPSP